MTPDFLSGSFFMQEEPAQYSIILFDGVCNLCNNMVHFVIKRDKKNVFKFAALQSGYGQNLLKKFGLETAKHKSIVLVENNKSYTKSTAALRIAKQLTGGWPLLYLFIIIPPFVRNSVYDFIATNRYKWFGKKETCWFPSAELKARFIDEL